jgi:hypothetical protein
MATVWIHRSWQASSSEVAHTPTPNLNDALKPSDAATVASGGLWDVTTAYRRYGDAVIRAGSK